MCVGGKGKKLRRERAEKQETPLLGTTCWTSSSSYGTGGERDREEAEEEVCVEGVRVVV